MQLLFDFLPLIAFFAAYMAFELGGGPARVGQGGRFAPLGVNQPAAGIEHPTPTERRARDLSSV